LKVSHHGQPAYFDGGAWDRVHQDEAQRIARKMNWLN
jgi:hypothetical protein